MSQPVRGQSILFCRDSIQFRPLPTAVRWEVIPRTWQAGSRRWAPRQVTFLALFLLFLKPCSHRYLTEFLEIRGVLIPLEILRVNHLKEEDKRGFIKLLFLTGDTSRKYKELICESCGTQHVHLCFVLIQARMFSLTSGLWAACCTEPFPSLCLLMADPAVLLWLEGVQSLSYC